MVLCVNQSLGMGKGKMCAQSAHAAVGVLDRVRASQSAKLDLALRQWGAGGQPKIALKVKDEAEMVRAAAAAAVAVAWLLCCVCVPLLYAPCLASSFS
jgi:PTH2 family peptidyl-tRNA hydrolase